MIEVVDLFCGAGGTSSGILKAARERLGLKVQLTAVNHWKTAINTHSLNHPEVKHLCENVENLHPMDLVRSGRLEMLAASCECRFHSDARGGGPCNEQSRSQAWQLVRWATDIRVESIMMENVREFLNWGPLHRRTKRPIASRKGEFFRAFVNALGNLGYAVEWRVQNAADFGDATSRKRLILIAQKGKKVEWPQKSHGPGAATPWRAARECIDWELKGTSIFDRKKPLCANTLRRIAAGLRKFGGEAAEPFLVMLNGSGASHLNGSARSVNDPLPTVLAGGGHAMICEPFVIGQQSGALPTVTSKRGLGICEAIVVQTDQVGGNGHYVKSVEEPLGTVVSKQNMLLVEPLVVKYYGKGSNVRSLEDPLATVTTKDRFMLVEAVSGREVAELDIRTRMLQPHELAAAHSFPKGYRFDGNKEEATRQIGNSVPLELAAAHAEAVLRGRGRERG